MHSKRVASVKQISKHNTMSKKYDKDLSLHSTDNSLTRLRQNSWKEQGIPFEDVTQHLKRCKDTCNSVNKRLNSKDKERFSLTSGISK